jgi:hypothetical protein
VETADQRDALPALPLGSRHGFLALLPVVYEGARLMSERAIMSEPRFMSGLMIASRPAG